MKLLKVNCHNRITYIVSKKSLAIVQSSDIMSTNDEILPTNVETEEEKKPEYFKIFDDGVTETVNLEEEAQLRTMKLYSYYKNSAIVLFLAPILMLISTFDAFEFVAIIAIIMFLYAFATFYTSLEEINKTAIGQEPEITSLKKMVYYLILAYVIALVLGFISDMLSDNLNLFVAYLPWLVGMGLVVFMRFKVFTIYSIWFEQYIPTQEGLKDGLGKTIGKISETHEKAAVITPVTIPKYYAYFGFAYLFGHFFILALDIVWTDWLFRILFLIPDIILTTGVAFGIYMTAKNLLPKKEVSFEEKKETTTDTSATPKAEGTSSKTRPTKKVE